MPSGGNHEFLTCVNRSRLLMMQKYSRGTCVYGFQGAEEKDIQTQHQRRKLEV